MSCESLEESLAFNFDNIRLIHSTLFVTVLLENITNLSIQTFSFTHRPWRKGDPNDPLSTLVYIVTPLSASNLIAYFCK